MGAISAERISKLPNEKTFDFNNKTIVTLFFSVDFLGTVSGNSDGLNLRADVVFQRDDWLPRHRHGGARQDQPHLQRKGKSSFWFNELIETFIKSYFFRSCPSLPKVSRYRSPFYEPKQKFLPLKVNFLFKVKLMIAFYIQCWWKLGGKWATLCLHKNINLKLCSY